MDNKQIRKLQSINDFTDLVEYLRDELDWPIEKYDFEELTFTYEPEELGLDEHSSVKISEIRRLRPLTDDQPWGIFFLKLEPKQLPIVALRRLLSKISLKKRASANKADQAAWHHDDILFISNFGEENERQLSFAHFSVNEEKHDLPILKVLGWDNRDTKLHIDYVVEMLREKLVWPDDTADAESWREQWREAFSIRHKEVVSTSKEMAIRLAELARNIRDSILSVLEVESDKGPLRQIMETFREALIHDLDEAGFADMYAQTIAYGLLSACIADPHGSNTVEHLGDHMRTNPFLRELMETFLDVGGRKRGKQKGAGLDFDELGVSEVVDLLDNANMGAVVRDFGDRNRQEDPVMHFYESFLHEYNKQLKVQRGVFYTPQPVVSYIVRSVHELLQTEFGLEDGLADTTTWGEMLEKHPDMKLPPLTDEPGEKRTISPDEPFVQILDPATGTATFLVEIIDVIYHTMTAKWKQQGKNAKSIDSLWNDYVPQHLLPRLHAYELMMAPYAIAHMKVGLKLAETGYSFETGERAHVYLTNALEPPGNNQFVLNFIPALAHEADAVNEIKQKKRFTVVIGNPPYSGVSSNMGPWVDGLLKGRLPNGRITESYYHIDGEPLGERKVWLQDDYVKFTRLSQWLLDLTGTGIHGYISNHGYLDNPTFRGMRRSLMQSFDSMRVLDLHGNVMKKESAPEEGRDANVFDIQQGVAIGLFIKSSTVEGTFHADLWGERESKYTWLLANCSTTTEWTQLKQSAPFYLFVPFDDSGAGNYYEWLAINMVMPINVTGVVTARDGFVTDIDSNALLNRIETFLDPQLGDNQVAKQLGLKENYAWRVANARGELRAATKQKRLTDFMTNILYRPFDHRFIFWHPSIVWRTRTEVMPHMLAGENVGLIFMRQVAAGDDYTHFGVSRYPVDNRAFYSNKGIMSFGPLYLYPEVGRSNDSLFSSWPKGKLGRTPNLDPGLIEQLSNDIGLRFISDGRGDLKETYGPEDFLAYIYSVFHSPAYRQHYEAQLKLDFPRVPMLGNANLFAQLVAAGHDLIALQLLESAKLKKPITKYIGNNPVVSKVGWTSDDGGTVWLDVNGAAKNFQPGTSGFRPVPEEVWNFHIGGYKVCEKWLKDRGPKKGNPGRTLTEEDIAHYHKIVIALTETIRIMAEIDEVIEDHGGWPGAFVTDSGGAKETDSEVTYPDSDRDQVQLDMVAEPKDG